MQAELLAGRAAVVTGVSRRVGIGFAIARRLLADGAAVCVQSWTRHDAAQPWGADPAGIDGVLKELAADGGRVDQVEADFADPDAPARVIASAHAAFDHVDILVVNHARSGSGTLYDLTATEVDAFLHENVRASLLLVKEFAAQHDGRPGGRVILLTSGQHLGGMPGEVAYAVSKGALHQATAGSGRRRALAGRRPLRHSPARRGRERALPHRRSPPRARAPVGAVGDEERTAGNRRRCAQAGS